jgi:hypothetical protein
LNAITPDIVAELSRQTSISWRVPHAGSPVARHVWCLPPDSRIHSRDGQIQVQDLLDGTDLINPDGDVMRIVSVEHRAALGSAAPTARLRWPVLVEKHAFAPDCPTSDTRLPAPTLIRLDAHTTLSIAHLVNGATLRRVSAGLAPWHWCRLTLDTHAIAAPRLRVNGLDLPGTPIADNAPGDPDPHAAPRLSEQFELPADGRHAYLRDAMADRALMLGHLSIEDPNLGLLVGATILAPTCDGALCRFDLDQIDRTADTPVWLLSRSGAPRSALGGPERRTLGVAVSGITAEQRTIPLDHWALGHGWHDVEESWRWTNGAAAILLPPGCRHLTIKIANVLRAYRLPQCHDDARRFQ